MLHAGKPGRLAGRKAEDQPGEGLQNQILHRISEHREENEAGEMPRLTLAQHFGERGAERGGGRHDFDVVASEGDDLLGVADHVLLGVVVGVTLVDDGVDAQRLGDLSVLEEVLELTDATLHVPLLVLGGVIAGVLAQVALLAGAFDLLGDLDATAGGQVVELGLQTVDGGSGELL